MKRYLFIILFLYIPAISIAGNASLDVSESALNNIVQRLGMLSDSGISQIVTETSIPGIENCHVMPTNDMLTKVLPGLEPTIPVLTDKKNIEGRYSPIYLDCPGIENTNHGIGQIEKIPLVFCETLGGDIEILPLGEIVSWQWWVTKASFEIDNGSMTFSATVTTNANGVSTTTNKSVPGEILFDSASSKIKIQLSNFQVPIEHEGNVIHQVDVANLYSFAVPLTNQTFTVPMIDGTQKTITGRVIGISPQYQSNNIHIDVDVGF